MWGVRLGSGCGVLGWVVGVGRGAWGLECRVWVWRVGCEMWGVRSGVWMWGLGVACGMFG